MEFEVSLDNKKGFIKDRGEGGYRYFIIGKRLVCTQLYTRG